MIPSSFFPPLNAASAVLIVALLAGCGRVQGPAEPATLARPEMDSVRGEVSFTIPCDEFGYAYSLQVDVAFKLKFITFFDGDGDPDTFHLQVSNRATYTNTTTGLSATSTDAGVDILDLDSGVRSSIGVIFSLTVPGKGVVALDAGTITFDDAGNPTFVAGPHQVFAEGDALLCAALA